jgi:hypothetical protein
MKNSLYMLIACLLLSVTAVGQRVKITGTVYDRTASVGLPSVTVHASNGRGTVTDSAGHYAIIVSMDDSLSFSYQGKATQQFPVQEMNVHHPFDISLRVSVQVLPTFEVITNSYRADSIAHRQEYRKYFDYSPEYLTGGGTNGVPGVNLDWLLSLRKAKRMEHFRQQLEEDERQKYIDHRFNRGLVAKLTGLKGAELDQFMVEYRPSYDFLMSFETEYAYFKYIKDASQFFADMWKSSHPEQQ